jgi:structural maintenance of chromosome 1
MDAISFVLGIKSSHLRSTQLRDLVYRGRVLKHSTIQADGTATEEPATQNGHANGAASDDEGQASQKGDPQTAWVMAVYEDEAGEEQKWKRSITASGQSEYRINNRVVTAKGYNDTLEAENILIKARNFLVFQGDVEAIASQSPRDLTRLIEQISGSLEFKDEYERLKLEADKAADEYSFRLNQRRAMNSEIKQYQEQKREADLFEEKVAERDRAVVMHVLWKLYHLQQQVESSGAEIQKHQHELEQHQRGTERSQQVYENARREQAKASRDCSKQERGIKQKEREIEERTSELVPIDEKITISATTVSRCHDRVDKLKRERDAQLATVNKHKKDLASVEKAQQRWEAEWDQATQKQGKKLSIADLHDYNRLRAEVTNATAQAQIKADQLNRQLKTDDESANSLKSRTKDLQGQAEKLKGDISDLSSKRADLTARAKQHQKDVDDKRTELKQSSSERQRAAQVRLELDEKLHDVLQKLGEADNGRRESDREARARETVATMKRIFPGVRGRLHELCKPKQKKYETAVDVVLGRHSESIVVDTEATARECIQYLRDQRLFPRTFIPLDTIKVKQINPNLKGVHRGTRLALDTIEYDAVYEKAMIYACGSDLVCDDLKIAKIVCYEKAVDCTAVTLDGTKISKGGLLTGGRGKQDRARRWEDAEVERYRKLKDKYLDELRQLSSVKSHRREEQDGNLQNDLEVNEQNLRFVRHEISTVERNLHDKKKELNHVDAQLKAATPKYNQQAKLVETLKKNLQSYEAAIEQAEDKVFAAFCQKHGYSNVRDYEAQQGTLQQEALERKLEFSTQKSRLENQLKFESEGLNSTGDRIDKLHDQLKQDQKLINALKDEKEALEQEIASFTEHIDSLKVALESFREEVNTKAEAVAQAKAELLIKTRLVDDTQKQIAEHEAAIQRSNAGHYALLRKCRIEEIKIPLAEESNDLTELPLNDMQGADPDRMDVDGEDLGDEDFQDYGIEVDFNALNDELKEDEGQAVEDRLKKEIDSLASEIEKMAPNMRATDRLEGVETRLRNMEKELDRSRRDAKRVKDDFDDVKERRLELFNKAFNHISEQIVPVYKDLTKSAATPLGGQAYLDTEDPDEPYLAGLKYHAMPPLKRFRDMEHLSGGEKTMAALALLFSVHSYQPSPFFVLDEVDAALDNANVAKLVGYIQRNAGPGMQFIVISLKPGFFEGSETLVGVMRDQAINSSKTLTLDVSDFGMFDVANVCSCGSTRRYDTVIAMIADECTMYVLSAVHAMNSVYDSCNDHFA